MHSIILMPRSVGPEEESLPYGEYSRESFQLTTPKSKRNYLAAQIAIALSEDLGSDIGWMVAKKIVGATGEPGDPDADPTEGQEPDDYYFVDHQSVFSLPIERPVFQRRYANAGNRAISPMVNRAFAEDFAKFLDRDDVAIGGGDDETPDSQSSLLSEGKKFDFDFGSGPWYARKDRGQWTLFEPVCGRKIRMSFDASEPAVEYADVPELVDLSITDYCDEGCGFCYRGSTTRGAHATMESIHALAYELHQRQVFEVAIGGGDPTLHPRFVEIISTFASNGISTAFTTRKLAWLKEMSTVLELAKNNVAFAYSAHKASDVHDLARALADAGIESRSSGVKASVQYVVGSSEDAEDFENLLVAAKEYKLPVTLLGYKLTGRGQRFGERPNTRWLEIAYRVMTADKPYGTIGIDTVLAERHGKELEQLGVPKKLMVPGEGRFSCFIDAVSMKMHRSSYSEGPGVSLLADSQFGSYPRLIEGGIKSAFALVRNTERESPTHSQ